LGCVNALTEWRGETLVSAAWRGNRLRGDSNFERPSERSKLFDCGCGNHRGLAIPAIFMRIDSFEANRRSARPARGRKNFIRPAYVAVCKRIFKNPLKNALFL
jgi:hypothetical protein